MRWTTLCIAACWLLAAEAATAARKVPASADAAAPALAADRACLACHVGRDDVLAGPMATRAGERAFARRAMGREGDTFFSAACAGCHVAGCRDCHDREPQAGPGGAQAPCVAASPAVRVPDSTCLRCHQGYFTGWEYHGRAPREDHERYQRGPVADGARYLKMLPDVHQERGLGCVDCHRVHAAAGVPAVKMCRDCHPSPSRDVPEHAISAHLEKMECWACHSAWAAQEYGTFLVKPRSDEQKQAFESLPEVGGWRRSAALRRQDAPPLGLDARGLVSPIGRSTCCWPPIRGGAGRIDCWRPNGRRSFRTRCGAGLLLAVAATTTRGDSCWSPRPTASTICRVMGCPSRPGGTRPGSASPMAPSSRASDST